MTIINKWVNEKQLIECKQTPRAKQNDVKIGTEKKIGTET